MMHTVQFDWLVPGNAAQQIGCSAAAGGQVHGCSYCCCLLPAARCSLIAAAPAAR
jgi:hypothetical protein